MYPSPSKSMPVADSTKLTALLSQLGAGAGAAEERLVALRVAWPRACRCIVAAAAARSGLSGGYCGGGCGVAAKEKVGPQHTPHVWSAERGVAEAGAGTAVDAGVIIAFTPPRDARPVVAL